MISVDQKTTIERAIATAEQTTSAEIKVVIRRHCWGSILRAAEKEFHKLELHETRHKNAVLILVVVANREFLIFGDEGIHQHVGSEFWEETSQAMASAFKSQSIPDGVATGVHAIAERLREVFPPDSDNPNELSDEVIVDDAK